VLLAHAPPSACFACCFSLPRRCPGVTRSTSVLLGRGGSMLRRPGWFRDLLLWCGSVDCARLAPAAVLCRPALCWTAALPLRCPAGWSGRGLRSLFTSVRICHPGEDWTARPRIPSPCRCVPGGRAHPAPAAALQGRPRRASTSPRRVGGTPTSSRGRPSRPPVPARAAPPCAWSVPASRCAPRHFDAAGWPRHRCLMQRRPQVPRPCHAPPCRPVLLAGFVSLPSARGWFGGLAKRGLSHLGVLRATPVGFGPGALRYSSMRRRAPLHCHAHVIPKRAQ